MEVFISWSGERSGKVAQALHDWLPSVIQSVTPFLSAADIEKGSRWSSDLAEHLEQSQFGLICLTPENLGASWLLFEAGALSKSIDNSRVVPYLYDVSIAQLQGPLTQFQASVADKESTREVLKSINTASADEGLDPMRLERSFETWWPDLEKTLSNIPETSESPQPSRSDRDLLEEVLRLCRQISRQGNLAIEPDPETLRDLLAHSLVAEPPAPQVDPDHSSQRRLSLSGSPETRRRAIERLRELHERERQARENLQKDSEIQGGDQPNREEPT